LSSQLACAILLRSAPFPLGPIDEWIRARARLAWREAGGGGARLSLLCRFESAGDKLDPAECRQVYYNQWIIKLLAKIYYTRSERAEPRSTRLGQLGRGPFASWPSARPPAAARLAHDRRHCFLLQTQSAAQFGHQRSERARSASATPREGLRCSAANKQQVSLPQRGYKFT